MTTKNEQWEIEMESGKIIRIPESLYNAEVIDVGKTSITDEDGTRNLVLIKFKILEGSINGVSYVGTEIQGLASWKLTEMSKLFKWISAMGKVVKIGEKFDIQNIVGCKCKILLKDKKRTFNNETTVISSVSEVLSP